MRRQQEQGEAHCTVSLLRRDLPDQGRLAQALAELREERWGSLCFKKLTVSLVFLKLGYNSSGLIKGNHDDGGV